jgi:hypothetical protein
LLLSEQHAFDTMVLPALYPACPRRTPYQHQQPADKAPHIFLLGGNGVGCCCLSSTSILAAKGMLMRCFHHLTFMCCLPGWPRMFFVSQLLLGPWLWYVNALCMLLSYQPVCPYEGMGDMSSLVSPEQCHPLLYQEIVHDIIGRATSTPRLNLAGHAGQMLRISAAIIGRDHLVVRDLFKLRSLQLHGQSHLRPRRYLTEHAQYIGLYQSLHHYVLNSSSTTAAEQQ